jgi:nitroreductase
MKVLDAIRTRRSVRLYQQIPISFEILRELVDAARLAPSCANVQPLQFIAVWDPEVVSQVFPTLTWAGLIAPQRDPPEGKRPVAYIVVLVDPGIHYFAADGHYDAGAAIENVLLAAWEKGIGACWIRRVEREQLKRILRVPEHLEIDSVISLGYPAERPVTEDANDSTSYYVDDEGTLHVPKRRLCDILHENHYHAPTGTGAHSPWQPGRTSRAGRMKSLRDRV